MYTFGASVFIISGTVLVYTFGVHEVVFLYSSTVLVYIKRCTHVSYQLYQSWCTHVVCVYMCIPNEQISACVQHMDRCIPNEQISACVQHMDRCIPNEQISACIQHMDRCIPNEQISACVQHMDRCIPNEQISASVLQYIYIYPLMYFYMPSSYFFFLICLSFQFSTSLIDHGCVYWL